MSDTMTLPDRMKFGIFLGPFHRVGENPTLAIDRDLELIQWLDYLGYDEAWIGEHHSAGWETISSPEIFIGVAADRTRHIKLGHRGHQPAVPPPVHGCQPDGPARSHDARAGHARSRTGSAPGRRVHDGHRPDHAAREDGRGVGDNSATVHRDRADHLQERLVRAKRGHVAAQAVPATAHAHSGRIAIQSPAGVALAGKYGASVLTITVPRDPSSGQSNLKGLWAIAEESAAEHGHTMDRSEWRLTIPVHLAEDRQQALDEARLGGGRYLREYIEETNGRSAAFDGPIEGIIDEMASNGSWIVGTPDDCIDGINRLQEQSGGFGGLLVQTIDWAPHDRILKSYELLARYVMPQFQGSVVGLEGSNRWAQSRKEDLLSGRNRAIDRAHQVYAERGGSSPLT